MCSPRHQTGGIKNDSVLSALDFVAFALQNGINLCTYYPGFFRADRCHKISLVYNTTTICKLKLKKTFIKTTLTISKQFKGSVYVFKIGLWATSGGKNSCSI